MAIFYAFSASGLYFHLNVFVIISNMSIYEYIPLTKQQDPASQQLDSIYFNAQRVFVFVLFLQHVEHSKQAKLVEINH